VFISRSGLTALLASCLLLPACSSQPYAERPIKPIRLVDSVHERWQQSHRNFIGFPSPPAFSVCHDLSCHTVTNLSLHDDEWAQVTRLFSPEAEHAESERQQIQQAIALLEKLVGAKIGTANDLAKNRLIGSRQGQLDCIDEATNTTVYLRMMESAGLLQWHRTAPRTSRGLLIGRAPHNTATIIDTQSSVRYAVDAWYFDNGEPPAIVTLDSWKKGWRPE
jgi:hypothetical protein